jgi:hypothetical protein
LLAAIQSRYLAAKSLVWVGDAAYRLDLAEETMTAMTTTIKADEKGRRCWEELHKQLLKFPPPHR